MSKHKRKDVTLSHIHTSWFGHTLSHRSSTQNSNIKTQEDALSVRCTWELRGLLLAPGERSEAQEAGDASVDVSLSLGLTPSIWLSEWAAAAGWKKSAGRWNKDEGTPASLILLPLASKGRGSQLVTFSFATFICLVYSHGSMANVLDKGCVKLSKCKEKLKPVPFVLL